MVRRYLGLPLIGVAAVLATSAAAQSTRDDVTVRNQRMPAAEAPRSATCEAMARDPLFRQQLFAANGDPLMGPRAYLPTRPPRNPDYSAPPLTPPGSPLPTLSKARFGVGQPVYAEQPGTGYVESSDVIASSGAALGGDPSVSTQTSLDTAIDACRILYAAPGVGAGGGGWTTVPGDGRILDARVNGIERMNVRFAQARAYIARNDTTLPMAFALFDQRRFAEALSWFRKAERKLSYREGGDEASLFVGKLYLQGLGAQSNPAEGIKWLRKTASLPYNPIIDTPLFDPRQPERNTAIGEAAVILANIYRTGFAGVPRDMAEACKWYERAEKAGHIPAAKMLGDIYYEGKGVPRDVAKAAAYYRRAARYDLADAQVALAGILESGEGGVAADPKAALAWYQAAARHENPTALYALARAYDLGQTVAVDQSRALGFYKTAALKGSPAARVAVGTYFHEGKLVPKDDAAARQWFAAAARDRDPDGMFNLAAMLANGRGGPRDLPGAWVWLKRAAAGGHATAPAAVAKVEAMMSPTERQAAAAQLARG
ncbi:MAG: tetratricopeptide repeat protein [Pseudomonadota bacterium]